MGRKFVLVTSSKRSWMDGVIFIPVGGTLCMLVPVFALISGQHTIWGVSLNTVVLIGIGFLLLAVIERLGIICHEMLEVTFLIKNLFKDRDSEDFVVADLIRMRHTVLKALGVSDEDI